MNSRKKGRAEIDKEGQRERQTAKGGKKTGRKGEGGEERDVWMIT